MYISGDFSLQGQTSMWIGLSDIARKDHYIWVSGNNLTFSLYPYPKSHTCVFMHFSTDDIGGGHQAWPSKPCSLKDNFICEMTVI